MGRTCLVNARFVDTFPVYDSDNYTKVQGLAVGDGDFSVETRYDGILLQPGLTYDIDDPDNSGEYRLIIPAGQLTQTGFYQVEVGIPAYRQRRCASIEVIDSLTEIVRSLYMGNQAVEFQIRTSQGAPLIDVAVQVFDVTGQTLIQAGKTSQSNGNLATTLDPGTYRVVLSKALTSFSNPFAITVPDNAVGTVPIPLIGTPLTIQPPTSPQLCRVFGYLQAMDGTYTDNYSVIVSSTGSGPTSYVASGGAVDPAPLGIAKGTKQICPDPVTGIWEVDLVQGMSANIQIEAQKINRSFLVPFQPAVNFKDVVSQSGAFFAGSTVQSPSTYSR